MVKAFALLFIAAQFFTSTIGGLTVQAQAADDALFVGTATCAQCHPDEAKRFETYSKKAHSFTSIERLAGKLTEQEKRVCYGCHTTGYGKPGGFVSKAQTPQLINLGCETCHGPGSRHVESEDPADLTAVTMEACMVCHNEDRVAAFKFKPLLFGGGH